MLGPDGRPLEPPTLLDVVRENQDSILPIVEVLSQRNNLLNDELWQASVSRILDAKGRPYLRVIK